MAAAIQLRRQGIDLTLYEKYRLGGTLRYANLVENYPGLYAVTGPELVQRMTDHMSDLGVGAEAGEVKSIAIEAGGFRVMVADHSLFCRSVIVATGTSPRTYPEHVPGLVYVDDIEDPSSFSGKRVCIIGGGDIAFDTALKLRGVAREVNIVSRTEPRALTLLVERAAAKDIGLYAKTQVLSIEKEKNYLINTSKGSIESDAVVISIGRKVNDTLIRDFEVKDIDYPTGRTNISGLYVIGDLATGKWRQVSIAVGMGVASAMQVAGFLAERTGESNGNSL